MDGRILDYVALVMLIFVLLTIIYAILFIHDIPYEIAKKRKHPHQDAILTAGWVSLFLLHTIWPFLWIWATLYKPDRGWGIQGTSTASTEGETPSEPGVDVAELAKRISQLEEQGDSRDSTKNAQLDNILIRVAQLEEKLQDQKEA